MAGDPVLRRRAAVAEICGVAARTVIERVVDEAVAASSRFGLTRERANSYATGIETMLPAVLDTMRLPDSPERSAGIDRIAREVRAVSEQHRVPRIVERGLTAIAIRIARELVRRRAADHGFGPDELEAEFLAFGDQLEARLFSG
ncbi:MAG TPA: hypothetical protein VFV20_04765 [Candidatus Limnocylindria bacterium]|nr:hypothetical protein [Candidatus Limnocylindria bacterium]